MLDNVHIDGSALISDSSAGVAVSEIITQDAADTDFESVRDTRVRWLLNNICDVTQSTTDKAAIIGDVQEGDRIFIVDANNTPIETVATNVTVELLSGFIPAMTSNTAPSGVASANNTEGAPWYIFDGNSGSGILLGSSPYVQYEFPQPTEALYFYYKMQFYSSNITYEFKLQGSNDGTNWATIDTFSLFISTYQEIKEETRKIAAPGLFKYYKIISEATSTNNIRMYDIQLFTEPGKTIDTSAVTNGTIPKYVYRFEDKIKFNSTLCTEKSIYKEFGTHGSQLYVQNLYNDALISGRTLQTTVEFSAPGNEVLEITGQIYKQP